jgi:hypothetical protein
MQQLLKHSFLRRINFLAGIILLTTILLFSCATRQNFGVSQIVPSAQGYVKIKTDKNNNYSIKLEIDHLASPDRLTPPRREYVVWMQTEQNGIKNIGKLKSSPKTLTGSLVTVTAFKPIYFFITAEDDADISSPGSTVILRTQ